MEQNIHYVYGYFRLDTNSFFYIGKGKEDRWKCKQNRPKHFMNIINKVPYVVFILYNNLSEEIAFQYEKEVIENLVNSGYSIDIKGYEKKVCHLTNQCWGGIGGLTGVPKNDYVRQCIIESNMRRSGKNSATSKKVVLLNNKEHFECMQQAGKKYNVNSGSISECCNNKCYYAGEYNGEKLVWVLEKNFINMTKEEIEEKLSIAQEIGRELDKTFSKISVRCIELNMEFPSLNKASKYIKNNYNISMSHKTIKKTIEKERNVDWCGEIEINGELVKLHWEYC